MYVVWAAYAGFCIVVWLKVIPSRALAVTAIAAFALPLASLWVIAATAS